MAVFRKIEISFWQDNFVLELTPEEKFFYLYLMTNSKTRQSGVYSLPVKVIEFETGYNRETVTKLINRFIEYEKIDYDFETKEIFIKNWNKHNPINNVNICKCIEDELLSVKSLKFKDIVSGYIADYKGLARGLEAPADGLPRNKEEELRTKNKEKELRIKNEEREENKKEKNINIQKEKTFETETEIYKEKSRTPDIQKTENIQDMPQQVGLVAQSDQHKSISEYSQNLKNSSEYAKYYKNFNQKKQYAEFVFMRTREYDELLIKYGGSVTIQAIEKLNNWKLEKLEKRCLKDIRGDDYRKILSWSVNAVIETMKKIDYKKYQEYMGQFDKQNNMELRMKISELINAKELTIEGARELPEESINNIYSRWLKKKEKELKSGQLRN